MILVAIASALATRLTFVVNLVLCLLIYFLGHLAPVRRARDGVRPGGGGRRGAGRLPRQALRRALARRSSSTTWAPRSSARAPLDLWQFAGYVATVFGYSLIYTAIALLVGLLLFEDRDLA